MRRGLKAEPDCKAVLLSNDATLIHAVEGAVDSVDRLGLEVVGSVEVLREYVSSGQAALVLLHPGPEQTIATVAGLLQELAKTRTGVETVVIHDEHQSDWTLALLRLGAAECLARPLDLSRLTYLVDVLTLQARHGAPRATAATGHPPLVRLGKSSSSFLFEPSTKMGTLIGQVRRIAPQDSTVLLGGETGTGKTRLAELIHHLSSRSDQPFMAINCGALAASLIESEMFGHVKGAFTGADAPRMGKFADVGRGTLFLDEVDSLPPALQAKLLRAVEERVFEPVGSNVSRPLEARLVAASNRSLEKEVEAGRFRADLFYRLNVVALDLPALRDQVSAIPALAYEFLTEYSARSRRSVWGISPEAMAALQAYRWPGNVRELRNVIERTVVLGSGPVVQMEDLPDAIQMAAEGAEAQPSTLDRGGPTVRSSDSEREPQPLSLGRNLAVAAAAPGPLAQSLEIAEKSLIARALEHHGNNRLRAAAQLGISRMTLYKKLHKYGLMSMT
jgi:two-component system response regulator HydG